MSAAAEATIECAPEIPPIGFLGRVARFMTGAAQLSLVWQMVTSPGIVTSTNPPSGMAFWIIAAITFPLLPWTVNLGFQRQWGRWPFYIAFGALAIGAGVALATSGSLWGPGSAGVIWAALIYVHGHMGVCHVLAALIGTRGCEMRAPRHLWALLTRGDATLCVCPGMWARLDAFESRLWGTHA